MAKLVTFKSPTGVIVTVPEDHPGAAGMARDRGYTKVGGKAPSKAKATSKAKADPADVEVGGEPAEVEAVTDGDNEE